MKHGCLIVFLLAFAASAFGAAEAIPGTLGITTTATNTDQMIIQTNSAGAAGQKRMMTINVSNLIEVLKAQSNFPIGGGGGGGAGTNANQFGVSSLITIKDRPLLTNAVNHGFLSITGTLAALEMHTGTPSQRWLLDPTTGAFNYFGSSGYIGVDGVPYFIFQGSGASLPTNFTVGGTNLARWLKLTGVTNERVAIITGDTNLSSHPDVSVAELSFLDGVTSSIQSQLNDTAGTNSRQFGSAVLSNLVNTVARNVTNIFEANRLYVRTNGDNATAQRGRMDWPFADPRAAVNAASAGDVIFVGAGRYVTNDLWKPGVSFYLSPDATIAFTTDESATQAGIFDDRTRGAGTNFIIGGNFEWFANESGDVDYRGGIFVVSNSLSMAFIDADNIKVQDASGTFGARVAAAVSAMRGYTVARFKKIKDDGANSSYASAVYWEDGECYFDCPDIDMDNGYVGWGVEIRTNTSANLWIQNGSQSRARSGTAFQIDAQVVSTNNAFRMWVMGAGEISGGLASLIVNGHSNYNRGSRVYITRAAKIQSPMGINSGTVWATADKFTSGASSDYLTMNGGRLFLEVNHYETMGNGAGQRGFDLNGGYAFIKGGALLHGGVPFMQRGGTNRIEGITIDHSISANATSAPIILSANGLTVKDVSTISKTDSSFAVNAGAAQTLDVVGYFNATKPFDPDITISGTSTNTIAVLHLPNLATNGILQLGPGGIIRTGAIDGSLSIEASGTIGVSTTNKFNRSQFHAWGGSNVQWRMVKNITLTNVVDVSAACYYPSNGTFFTIHNNANGRITEWTLDGIFVRKIDGTGSQVPDAEAITYLGGNNFAVSDEDNNRIFILGITNNASGSTWDTNNTRIIQVHSSVGTDPATGSGIEGLNYDWDRQGWWIAREKTPAQLLFLSADGQTTNNFFSTAQMQAFTNANHTDFSDVFLDRENQILWVTQDEPNQFDRVLGIDLVTSNVLITLTVTNFGQLEGVSLTPDGKLLLAGEVNQFAIFEPVLGGLNSGQSWEMNSQTNLPYIPRFPFGVSIGDAGAWVTNVLTATAALNFPDTVAQSFTNLSIAVTGAADGDVVNLGVPNAALMPGTCYTATASNNIVWIRHNNYSSTAKDPASATFRVTVEKFR